MPLDPPTALGSPVVTTRGWANATAPRTGGGHMFIQHAFSYDTDVPTEWILTDKTTGEYTIVEGPNRIYSQSTSSRASNGRIYFVQRSTPGALNECTVNLAYYDPTDETMHFLDVTDPTEGARHQIIYKMEFNVSGSMLYGGTISSGGFKPMIFSLNPLTGETTFLASVGTASALPKYAYYLAADGNYLYVAVGQDTWELVCINLTTLEQTTLYTTTGPGTQFMEFEVRTKGFTVNLRDNGVALRYWMADGILSTFVSNAIGPPGGDRTVTRYTNPLVEPPQTDFTHGIGQILWRDYGSVGAWTTIDYEVTYRTAQAIESLCALTDGTVLGNAEQYSGFFRYDPESSETTWFGEWVGGVSQPTLLNVDATTLYFAGYPNGALYLYDPTQPWVVDTNPVQLGSFGQGVRYPKFLIKHTNGRIYTAGRRANDSVGSGISYYTISTDTFATPVTDDDFYPRGFVLLSGPGLLVSSNEVITSYPSAPLITYDLDMVEQNRWTVVTGLQDTGLLFTAPEPNCVIGLTTDAPCLLYKFDVVVGAPISSVPLGSVTITATAQDSAGYIWAVIDSDLVRIDPVTLRRETRRTGIV